ncbi:hypothetical protein ACJVC5_15015 [Peredibacter sp. HCB2-198]|uniref:hypothetical protein n=1 Tax=Peredibacter sp. HCB2-198 TaxID=3383025 RepID=UPI0038B67DF2
MKVLFLIFTILFSASVFADCCNFEVQTSHSIEMEHHDEHEEKSHSTQEHCHCSPINHLKILPQDSIALNEPTSIPSTEFFAFDQLKISKFESSIFHPPIA